MATQQQRVVVVLAFTMAIARSVVVVAKDETLARQSGARVCEPGDRLNHTNATVLDLETFMLTMAPGHVREFDVAECVSALGGAADPTDAMMSSLFASMLFYQSMLLDPCSDNDGAETHDWFETSDPDTMDMIMEADLVEDFVDGLKLVAITVIVAISYYIARKGRARRRGQRARARKETKAARRFVEFRKAAQERHREETRKIAQERRDAEARAQAETEKQAKQAQHAAAASLVAARRAAEWRKRKAERRKRKAVQKLVKAGACRKTGKDQSKEAHDAADRAAQRAEHKKAWDRFTAKAAAVRAQELADQMRERKRIEAEARATTRMAEESMLAEARRAEEMRHQLKTQQKRRRRRAAAARLAEAARLRSVKAEQDRIEAEAEAREKACKVKEAQKKKMEVERARVETEAEEFFAFVRTIREQDLQNFGPVTKKNQHEVPIGPIMMPETTKKKKKVSSSPSDWAAEDVAAWLRTQGVAEQVVLEEVVVQGITGSLLKVLDGEDLRELGVARSITRKKILVAIDRLFTSSSPPSPSPPTSPSSFRGDDVHETVDDADCDCDCVVCWDAPKQCCFIPCGHMCVCESCGRQEMARTSRCPRCRAPATKLMRVY